MKKAKIFNEIIKANEKEERIYIAENNNVIAVSLDGCVAYYFNKKEFIFDYNKFKNKLISNVLFDCITKINEYKIATKSDEIITIDDKMRKNKMRKNKKITINKLFNDEHTAYFNSKFLKFFEEDVTFSINVKSKYKPIIVYENAKIVGIIMPMRYDENEA